MRRPWTSVLAGFVATVASAAAAPAAPFVWIESERPTRSGVEYKTDQWAGNPIFSEGKWLQVSLSAEDLAKRPGGAVGLLEYDFSLPQPGRFEVWNRVGLEFVRSPFAWRIDQAEWQTATPEMLTCDLVEVGFWCEVAWLRLGEASLPAGRHTLQIRPLPTMKEEKKKERGPGGAEKEVVVRTPEKILYASDCVCLVPGPFRPNGRYKPGEDWRTAADRKAAAQVFRVAAAGAPGNDANNADSTARIETSLAGDWEVCRYDEQDVVDRTGPTKTLPDAAAAFWSAIAVPGNKFDVKPHLRFCHRMVYRTRVDVPASLAGRSFVLRFPSQSLIASVHVNKQFCGWTRAPFAQWDCDVTHAIRPGAVNEVCVVIKDSYYAISEKKSGRSCRMSFNLPIAWIGAQNWVSQHFDFPIGSPDYGGKSGLLAAPRLIVAGEVYTADAFVQPSVRKKQIAVELTLANPTSAERKVEIQWRAMPAASARVLAPAQEKTFAPREATIPAGGQQVVGLVDSWENPRLWWPDDPAMYRLIVTLRIDGRAVDAHSFAFGFREWEWSTPQFKLNGVPWQLWADCTQLDGGRSARDTIALWRKHSQNSWRFWGQQFAGLDKQQTLDLMDSQGIIVRRSGIFDGQGANYLHLLASGPELFDHWREQLAAWVKEERNHPSILVWSLENEVTFINSRNLGISKDVEPHIARAARAVMQLDPTRPAMVDGGNCLIDESLPVNGVHYQESHWRDYPDEAYTLAKAYQAHEKPMSPTWGKIPWRLVPERPIFMGESYFVRGSNPAAFSQFAGEGCFAGWGSATQQGAGLLAKMLAEGYRWHGVAAQHFWFGDEDASLHYNSWRPVCVLCRQWNWTFAGGSTVSRTLKVCNDTRFDGPIQWAWELWLGDRRVAGQENSVQLAAGGHREVHVAVPVPAVTARTAGRFVLTCRRGGREVFRETKPIAVLNGNEGPRPPLDAASLAVIDPHGAVRQRLRERGIAFTEAASLTTVSPQAKVIVVGKDAVGAREASDPMWLARASRGTRLVVLDQANPLHYQALPADLTPTDFVGRIAFPENPEHPAFAGLAAGDFLTWSGDHVVYRNPYKKATRGAVSLAHCDEQLGYSALAECPVNDGLMLLCQMVVGEKLATDPVAHRLFDNLVDYAARYALVERATAVAMPPDSPALRLLAESGLKFDRVDDPLATIAAGKHQIVVVDASAKNLSSLTDAAAALAATARVRAFTESGGWLIAWGLAPDGLAHFNRLVGVEHVLRPFELERVAFAPIRDPILTGLTVRDITLESAEQMFPWAGDKYLADDEFSWIVDLEDIAPFCAIENSKAGDVAARRAGAADWPRNMVNGFTSADGWKLIHYLGFDNPKRTFTLPREEEIRGLSIVLNTHYAKPTRLELYFDDDATPLALTVKPDGSRQDFNFAPRKARKVAVKLAQFDKTDKVTGIDNLWLHVTRSDQWKARVRPLLNIGGLVKYPQGRGGVVLNQVLARPSEAVPVNAQKKQAIVAALLRNLHATFAGGRILTAANLAFRPLPLEEQCNQYLTKDRGWVEGGRDLAHLPIGRQEFCGVSYVIRDFRTSPLPSCVMLAGPGARGSLPQSVRGLKAGGRVDVLFFLHTMHRTAEWRPSRPDEPAPVVFRYVIHYADGKTADAPVLYGEGVDHWLAREPKGLRSAALAWSAAAPGDTSGEQAAVYQWAWTNPRPDVPIASIDLEYGPEGNRYGVPALLAITAATAK